LPNINKIFSLVIQQERQITILILLKQKICLILLTNNHTYGYNKNNILGSKLVEETIDVDRVKGEVEEGSIMKDDSVHIVIKQIIQWMNATLDMDILHGINIGHISLSLQSNHKERECAEL